MRAMPKMGWRIDSLLMNIPENEIKIVNNKNRKIFGFHSIPDVDKLRKEISDIISILKSEEIEVKLIRNIYKGPEYLISHPLINFPSEFMINLASNFLICWGDPYIDDIFGEIAKNVLANLNMSLYNRDETKIPLAKDMIFYEHRTIFVAISSDRSIETYHNIRKICKEIGLDCIPVHIKARNNQIYLRDVMCPVAHSAVLYNPAYLNNPEDLFDIFDLWMEIPHHEWREGGIYPLVIDDGKVILQKQFPETINLLREYGIEVIETEGSELMKTGRGPGSLAVILKWR